MYGRGANSIAEQINQTVEQAQEIIDKFYGGFPRVKEWINKTNEDAHVHGYVEDLWGRRRRLPDVKLPRYEVRLKNSNEDILSDSINFNPFIGSLGKVTKEKPFLISKYENSLKKCRGKKDVDTLKEQAFRENVIIKDNTGFISQAERQCVNARVQGGAASMSKRAMINVYKDQELRNLKFRLLISVHDELIGECPIENAEQVKQRLSCLMIESAKPDCTVPMKCDAEAFSSWYADEYENTLKESYSKLIKSGLSKESAYEQILNEHEECTEEQIKDILYSE